MNVSHLSWLLIPLAIFIGALLPIQGALLSKLGPLLNHPIQATLVSYLGGAFVCILILVIAKSPNPTFQELSVIDWKLYTAGFLGAIFVSGMLYLMPVVGVANMLAAAIVGQLVASILIDHFGLLSGLRVSISPSRIFGVVLLLIGLYFIQRKTL
ncbi:DMT family transporter [Porticoccaceae bacterium]|nr:DMT family transporter [Porticoccaceae bacterium]